MDLDKEPEAISSIMLSNEKVPSMDPTREAEVLIPKEENPRLKSLKVKSRWAFDADGKALPKAKIYGLRDGLFESILDKFYEDPTLIAYGEDNRDWGGAYAVYRGLTEAIPYHRFFNAPISESAIIGSAVGYAMCRRTRDSRAYVCRLYRLRGRRNIQSGRQVAVDVCRYTENARYSPRLGR
ncbi:MAG: hypothetical protein V8S82_07760 [Eubacteriales bacterium]